MAGGLGRDGIFPDWHDWVPASMISAKGVLGIQEARRPWEALGGSWGFWCGTRAEDRTRGPRSSGPLCMQVVHDSRLPLDMRIN